jgi:hypothetical protein
MLHAVQASCIPVTTLKAAAESSAGGGPGGSVAGTADNMITRRDHGNFAAVIAGPSSFWHVQADGLGCRHGCGSRSSTQIDHLQFVIWNSEASTLLFCL